MHESATGILDNPYSEDAVLSLQKKNPSVMIKTVAMLLTQLTQEVGWSKCKSLKSFGAEAHMISAFSSPMPSR